MSEINLNKITLESVSLKKEFDSIIGSAIGMQMTDYNISQVRQLLIRFFEKHDLDIHYTLNWNRETGSLSFNPIRPIDNLAILGLHNLDKI